MKSKEQPKNTKLQQSNDENVHKLQQILLQNNQNINIEELQQIENNFKGTSRIMKKYAQDMKYNEHILNEETLKLIYKDLKSHFFNNKQAQQFVNFLKLLHKTSSSIRDKESLCKIGKRIQSIGQQYNRNINEIHFKHYKAVRILQKLFSTMGDEESKINLNKLTYNMNNKVQILKVSNVVKAACQENLNAFFFLAAYLKQCCINMEKTSKCKVIQIEKQLLQALEFLRKQHPPNDQIPTGDTTIKIKGQKKLQHTLRLNLKQIESAKKNLKLQEFILQVAQLAKDNEKQLIQITKASCLKNNGIQFKTGLKVKNKNSQSSIDRVKQKLLSKNFKKYQITNKETNLFQMLKQEKKIYHKTIEQIFNAMNEDIVFNVSDMVRGKCMFESIGDIKITAVEIINKINEKGYSYQIDNRLSQKTTDLVFKIKIGQIIAEFQLAYKFNVVKNEFNHKIYELARSKFYSALNTLFIYDQKSEEYFNEILSRVTKLDDQRIQVRIKINQKQKLDQISTLKKQFSKFLIDKKYDLNSEDKKKNQIAQKMMGLNKIILQGKQNKGTKNKYISEDKRFYFNGLFLMKIYKTTQAIESFKKAKILIEKQGALSEDKVFISHQIDYQLAENLRKNGKLKESLEYYQKGLKYLKEEESYIMLTGIGSAYYSLCKYPEALKYYEKSLHIQQKLKGKVSTDVAIILNNIGLAYKDQGKYNEALKVFQECLQIKNKLHGEDSIDTASTLNNIGNVFQNLGKYLEALKFYEKSLKIQQHVKGQDSIETNLTLNNIGTVYRNLGKYTEALKYFQKALKIQQKVKGKESIDTTITLTSIANVYFNQKNYPQALKFYEKYLKIKQKILGEETIDVALVLNNIGAVYFSQQKYSEALKFFMKCLKITQKVKGQQSIDCQTYYQNIGLLYQMQKDYNSAVTYLQKSLKIRVKAFGQNDQLAKGLTDQIKQIKLKIKK